MNKEAVGMADEAARLAGETERISEEADDAWSKIKGMFGDDDGLADTTEAQGMVDVTIGDLRADKADADWLVL